MSSRPLAILLLLITLLPNPLTCQLVRVGGPAHSLVARDLVQGWALTETVCPQGTGVCGRASCCPVDSFCDTTDSSNSNFCCPTEEPCGYNVTHGGSNCAVATWVKWTTRLDPICCMPGEIGVQPVEGATYGNCEPAGTNVPADQMASMVGAAGGSGSTSIASSSTSASAAGSSSAATAVASGAPEATKTASSSATSQASSPASTGAASKGLGVAVAILLGVAGGAAAYVAV